jgi:hypothetical protein
VEQIKPGNLIWLGQVYSATVEKIIWKSSFGSHRITVQECSKITRDTLFGFDRFTVHWCKISQSKITRDTLFGLTGLQCTGAKYTIAK